MLANNLSRLWISSEHHSIESIAMTDTTEAESSQKEKKKAKAIAPHSVIGGAKFLSQEYLFF